MPRKRKQVQLEVKPQASAHPSLQTASRRHGQQQEGEQSNLQVNDLLQRLRRVHATTDSGSQGVAMNPALHQPLLFPPSYHQPPSSAEPLTARERMIARARQRRLPGPPAPPSWSRKESLLKFPLQPGEAASKSARKLDRLPELRLPEVGTLSYMLLKKVAQDWHECLHVHHGQWLSVFLQVHQKQALLAFLLAYGPDWIPPHDLELLFLDNVDDDGLGSGSGISHANLGYALNPVTDSTGYRDLARLIFGREYLKAVANNKLGTIAQSGHQDDVAVPDSWDADEAESMSKLVLSPKVKIGLKFDRLTHLSLAHASRPSWKYLLRDLTPHLKQLTHLSLAYWPPPCLLPNSRTASVRGPTGEISVSATGFYSDMDGDWGEAAAIMQQLGKDLICLRWLDLEGCSFEGGWVEALRYAGWRQIDWPNTFRGLHTLHIGQGQVPAALTEHDTRDDFVSRWVTWACAALRGTAQPHDTLFNQEWLQTCKTIQEHMRNHDLEITPSYIRSLLMWLARENRVEGVAEYIDTVRRVHGVAQKLSVHGSSYPAWAASLIRHTRQTPEAMPVSYGMLREIGLSTSELEFCATNLKRILLESRIQTQGINTKFPGRAPWSLPHRAA